MQFVSLAGNDTLTISLAGGDAIPAGGVSFDGGAGTSDRLLITGAGQGAATLSLTGPAAGSFTLANFGTVTFTGARIWQTAAA